MQKWRVIKNKTYDGAMNMAIDEAIMIAHKEGKCKPTLRFYTWEPACITLGYFQKHEEVDFEKCKELNIDVVRRATGGRAVLHDDELTYSVVVDEKNPLMSKSISESYKFISQGLARGLYLADITTDKLSRGERIGRDNLSAACFNAHASYEITLNNKKIVGSAQHRNNEIILQHGSIVIDFDVEKLFKVIKTKDEETKQRAMRYTNRKASGIENELDIKVDINVLQENLIKGIKEHMDIEFIEEELSEYELSLAKELYKKYSSEEYNKKR